MGSNRLSSSLSNNLEIIDSSEIGLHEEVSFERLAYLVIIITSAIFQML